MEELDKKEVAQMIDSALSEKVESIIRQFVTVSSEDLSKRIVPKLTDLFTPISEGKEAYLRDELARSNVILTEVNKSFIGWLLLKRIEKKLKKQGTRI